MSSEENKQLKKEFIIRELSELIKDIESGHAQVTGYSHRLIYPNCEPDEKITINFDRLDKR